jgi:GGDEF domain-containing protein
MMRATRVLCEVAQKLKGVLRESDIVSRIWGAT